MAQRKLTLILLGLISFTCFGFINSGNAQTSTEGWSVNAANWMQYWYHRPANFDSLTFFDPQSRQDSLDNRFIVDFDLGDFYAGAWLRVLEPNRPDTSFERIAQRYFGWQKNGFTLHVGNFYQVFDRGLTLNTFLDDAVYNDNNLDGVKFSGLYDHFEFDALSARGLRFKSDERAFIIRGVRGAVKPLLGIKSGFSYVRFKQNDPMAFDKANNTNVTSVNSGINRGPFDIYAEYAWRRGLDEFGTKVNGDGAYLSGSFSYSLASVYAEYKNIINLLYPGPIGAFNTPPPVSHQGRTLSSKAAVPGERAYQIGALISPNFNLNFDLAFSESYSRGFEPRLYMAEKFAGTRLNLGEKLTFNSHWDRFDFSLEDEVETYFDTYYYLNPRQTISAIAYVRRFWPQGGQDYHEDYLTLGFAHGGFLQINIGGSKTSADIGQYRKLAFIECTIRFRSNELIIFQGGERGGLVCSSGICSIRPTFEGTRVMLFSRF